MLGSSIVPGSKLIRRRIGVVGADDCDFVTTPTQFLVQEPCLKRCTVGVGDSREIAEDGYLERATVAGRQSRERRFALLVGGRVSTWKTRSAGASPARACVSGCAASFEEVP